MAGVAAVLAIAAVAAIVVASLLGILFFQAVALAERIVLRWQPEFHQ